MPDELDLTPDDDEEAPEGATDEPEAAENENDPAAALAARFDRMERIVAGLSGLDANAVKSAIGRISALQSSVEDLSKRDPMADLDPRVSASEGLVEALAEALINDPVTSDATRATLQSALRGVTGARTTREQAQREAELLAKVTAAAQPKPAATAEPADDDPWQVATAIVVRRAAVLKVDASKIPWDEIQRDSNNDAGDATALAIEWLLEHKEDAPTTEVSRRKAAAGGGSPKREAAPASGEQLRARAEAGSIPMTDEAARKALAKELGVSLA